MKINKLLILMLAIVAMLGVTACDNDDEPLVDESGKSVIRIFMNGGNEYDGRKKDSVWLKIEEEANVSLKIEGATHNSDYYQTLNPMINTGDIPDVIFTVPSSSGKAYSNWVEQELLWNIDELIAEKPGEYPYIEALLNSDQYKNITYGDGAHTMIPYITSNSGWGIYYRTDWLVNVGYTQKDENGNTIAKTPKTIEEFQEVLKLFTENDPDGNGKKDTYGLSPMGDTFYLNPLYHAFGVTPDYDLDAEGNPTYMYLQPEFKNFLSWFNQMFENGYIDPDFATNKNNMDREKFFEEKVGILITNAETHVTWIGNSADKAFGENNITFGDAPMGTKNLGKEGAQGFSDWGGWWGGYSISKDCYDPHAALRLFNYLYSPEGLMTRCYGIEGIHYSVVDGEVTPLVDGRNEEPEGSFVSCIQPDGTSLPTGYYKLGSAFSGNFAWNDDYTKITSKVEAKFIDLRYIDLIELGIKKNTLCSSKLTNVTGFYASYATKMSKIEDELNIYAMQVMMGQKNLTSDYNSLLEKLDGKNYDWSGVRRMIAEVARNAGVIK